MQLLVHKICGHEWGDSPTVFMSDAVTKISIAHFTIVTKN